MSNYSKEQDLKILKVLLREQSKLLFQIQKSLNPENLDDLEKSGKIRKPDEIPEKKIIMLNLRSKPLIMLRNMVKPDEILR